MIAAYNTSYKTAYRYSKYKKACRTRRNVLLLFISIVVFFALVVFTSNSYAEGSITTAGKYKYYREIHLHYGDSLEKIADSFTEAGYSSRVEFIKEIRQINDLKSSKWTDLTVLLVPYYSDEYK